MEKLPSEIITHILKQVRRAHRLSDLRSCILCCKLWRSLGQHLLTENIVLDEWSLESFLASMSTRQVVHIRSLTMHLERGYPVDEPFGNTYDNPLDPSFDPNAEPVKPRIDIGAVLPMLAPYLSQMQCLASFSLHVKYERREVDKIRIDSRVLIAILLALPLSCTMLELDTLASDGGECSNEFDQAFQAVLPRLEFLRLRLFYFPRCLIDRTHGPNLLSKIRVLIICLVYDAGGHGSSNELLRVQLCRSLEQCYAKEQVVRIVDWKHHDDGPRSNQPNVYDAMYRRDVHRNQTLIMPTLCVVAGGTNARAEMIRMPGAQDYLSGWDGLEVFAEGEHMTWRETSHGARHPFQCMKFHQYRVRDVDATSKAAWRSKYRQTCELWSCEANTCQTLLDAEEQQGILEAVVPRMRVPSGWKARHFTLVPR